MNGRHGRESVTSVVSRCAGTLAVMCTPVLACPPDRLRASFHALLRRRFAPASLRSGGYAGTSFSSARWPRGRRMPMSANARFKTLTRLGFAARGLLYIVIALLLFRSGRSEDVSGALAELGKEGGDPLLLAMAAGFIAYGLWRLADAALNIEGHGDGAKGLGGRLAAGGSGLVYSA